MKRLLLLSIALAMIVMSMSPAVAQSFLNSGGNCPEGLVEQGDFCTTPEAAQAAQDNPFACEGLPTDEEFVACLDSLSAPATSGFTEPGPADGVCEGAGEGDPDCVEALRQGLVDSGRLAPEAPASTEVPEAAPAMTTLPDTGGVSLIALGAGALLLGSGLLIRKR